MKVILVLSYYPKSGEKRSGSIVRLMGNSNLSSRYLPLAILNIGDNIANYM